MSADCCPTQQVYSSQNIVCTAAHEVLHDTASPLEQCCSSHHLWCSSSHELCSTSDKFCPTSHQLFPSSHKFYPSSHELCSSSYEFCPSPHDHRQQAQIIYETEVCACKQLTNLVSKGRGRLKGMTKLQRFAMAGCFAVIMSYIIISQVTVSIFGGSAEPAKPEMRKLCSTSMERTATFGAQQEDPSLPLLYIVTPTYRRPEMVAELTRLGQTLLLVPRVHWILPEDSHTCSSIVTDTLTRIGLPYTHLATPMPEVYRKQTYVPRGVANRRAAVSWIQNHAEPNSVLYFLDDDNSIDVRLLEQMRYTEKVSMFPVGLIGKFSVSSPVLNKEGRVTDFYDGWPAGRKFQVDMAGFAVNVGYLKKQPRVTMPYIAGHEEDGFLKSLNLQLEDIEPLANGCSEVLVWHTRTFKNQVRDVRPDKEHSSENVQQLLSNMRRMSMVR
uniref:Galactosylgalactosylxylosylprotein 3-beta-glucuronosyltransferase n=3 Tax=Hirondellea gigas TaxID=1518452 RepID=A0A6A7G1L9_9CRUS